MSRTTIRTDILAAALALLAAGPATAQTQEFVVPLSAPGQPAILDVNLNQGGLVVEAFDGDQIVIESRSPEPAAAVEKVDGMYRIPNNSIGLKIEERDNTVSISTDWNGDGIQLAVKVPRRTSIRAQVINGSDLVVSGVSGQHELKNINGSIEARGIRGSLVANSRNGGLTIEFLEIAPDTPMSFITWNGAVDVTFPPDLRATLKMQAGQGDIQTDFPVELRPSEPARTEQSNGKGYRVELNREVVATVGGGGAEMRFKTFNGSILIRKAGG